MEKGSSVEEKKYAENLISHLIKIMIMWMKNCENYSWKFVSVISNCINQREKVVPIFTRKIVYIENFSGIFWSIIISCYRNLIYFKEDFVFVGKNMKKFEGKRSKNNAWKVIIKKVLWMMLKRKNLNNFWRERKFLRCNSSITHVFVSLFWKYEIGRWEQNVWNLMSLIKVTSKVAPLRLHPLKYLKLKLVISAILKQIKFSRPTV